MVDSGPGRTTNGGADKGPLAKIPGWASTPGHTISDRGRISATMQVAYHAAN